MKDKIEIEHCEFSQKKLQIHKTNISFFLSPRTRLPNATPASQTPLSQSTVSMSTITGSSDYSSSSSSNDLYHIITGSISKNQTASFQQLTIAMGPLDSNMLEIGQNVLLSTQDNINFIHEIFRQVKKYFINRENFT